MTRAHPPPEDRIAQGAARDIGDFAPILASKRTRLRPVENSDLPALYAFATHEKTFWRWRFNGVVPTMDAFVRNIATGVLVQYAVLARQVEAGPAQGGAQNPLVGLVVAYNADLRNGTTYLATLATEHLMGRGVIMEASFVFMDYLFTTWPLRKIYSEVLSFNYEQFRSGVGRNFQEQGRLREHYYMGGRRWDQYVIAVDRDRFYEDAMAMRIVASARVPEGG